MSDYLDKKRILLVGAGYMAIEYAKVLKAMNLDFIVVGNSKENALKLQEECNIDVIQGGIEKYIDNNGLDSEIYAINAVNVKSLYKVNNYLVTRGCRHILSEKPGIATIDEGKELLKLSNEADLFIAYNRRFYSSVLVAEDIIKSDGGVTSFNIEFTEWRHIFDKESGLDYLDRLFLANSSHVVDLAFYLSGGKVKTISSIVSGQNNIEWHKSGSVFGGVGETDKGQIFTYSANWDAPGRWAVELNTKNHRLIFRPLERLQLQDKGSVKIYEANVDYSLDEAYKPGLYKEVEAFLSNNKEGRLCTIEEQVKNMNIYSKMSGEKL